MSDKKAKRDKDDNDEFKSISRIIEKWNLEDTKVEKLFESIKRLTKGIEISRCPIIDKIKFDINNKAKKIEGEYDDGNPRDNTKTNVEGLLSNLLSFNRTKIIKHKAKCWNATLWQDKDVEKELIKSGIVDIDDSYITYEMFVNAFSIIGLLHYSYSMDDWRFEVVEDEYKDFVETVKLYLASKNETAWEKFKIISCIFYNAFKTIIAINHAYLNNEELNLPADGIIVCKLDKIENPYTLLEEIQKLGPYYLSSKDK